MHGSDLGTQGAQGATREVNSCANGGRIDDIVREFGRNSTTSSSPLSSAMVTGGDCALRAPLAGSPGACEKRGELGSDAPDCGGGDGNHDFTAETSKAPLAQLNRASHATRGKQGQLGPARLAKSGQIPSDRGGTVAAADAAELALGPAHRRAIHGRRAFVLRWCRRPDAFSREGRCSDRASLREDGRGSLRCSDLKG
jgi:hypothetical protein